MTDGAAQTPAPPAGPAAGTAPAPSPDPVTALAAQVYRFARRSDVVQQQQLKWVVYGGVSIATLRGLGPDATKSSH